MRSRFFWGEFKEEVNSRIKHDKRSITPPLFLAKLRPYVRDALKQSNIPVRVDKQGLVKAKCSFGPHSPPFHKAALVLTCAKPPCSFSVYTAAAASSLGAPKGISSPEVGKGSYAAVSLEMQAWQAASSGISLPTTSRSRIY